jgi:hypothetical protein
MVFARIFGALAGISVAWSLAWAQPSPETGTSLGKELYSTHCDSCHTTQVHWRDKRIAKDWTGLVSQVRRWQANIGLGWSDQEILEVTRYLNSRYYRFAEKEKRASVTPRRSG